MVALIGTWNCFVVAMMRASLLFVFSLLLASSSFAEDCAPIDVRTGMPAPLQEFFKKPRQQGDVGWCYAYATADLLSQYTGTPVSAFHVASVYNLNLGFFDRLARNIVGQDGSKGFESGFISNAVSEMRKRGVTCNENMLHSFGLMVNFQSTSIFWDDSITTMSDFLKLMAKAHENQCDQTCQRQLDAFVPQYAPALTGAYVRYFMSLRASVSFSYAILELSEIACSAGRGVLDLHAMPREVVKSNPGFLNNGSYQVYESSQGQRSSYSPDFLRFIDRSLEDGRLVGLSYNMGSILLKQKSVFTSGHASSIMGRRKINGLCYYQIRNSWGNHCAFRAPVLCNEEDGSLWVDSETLNRISVSATVIPKSRP